MDGFLISYKNIVLEHRTAIATATGEGLLTGEATNSDLEYNYKFKLD
jgi:hypothetical protein